MCMIWESHLIYFLLCTSLHIWLHSSRVEILNRTATGIVIVVRRTPLCMWGKLQKEPPNFSAIQTPFSSQFSRFEWSMRVFIYSSRTYILVTDEHGKEVKTRSKAVFYTYENFNDEKLKFHIYTQIWFTSNHIVKMSWIWNLSRNTLSTQLLFTLY